MLAQPAEVARFTNAAARMIDVYQNACLVLQKLKTKGTQRVVVQYQQVTKAAIRIGVLTAVICSLTAWLSFVY